MTEQTSSNRWHKLIKWLWIGFIVAVIGIAALILLVSTQKLPTFQDLENPTDNLASEVYFSDGKLLGRYFTENRVPVKYEDISPNVIKALIATEDKRFYKHSGIDIRALFRVGVKTVLLQQKSAGGGSTISQQLAKLLYPRLNLSGMNIFKKSAILVNQKLKEWITAVKLEKSYTKEEIIAMYLNEYDYLFQSHGIKAAAETYFAKDPMDLNIIESATLVGMHKNSYYFNPKIFPERALSRRNVVLKLMQKEGLMSKEDMATLQAMPIDLTGFHKTKHDTGPAPYFRAELKKHVKKLLNDEKILKPDGSVYNLDQDGLRIHTTLDSRMQAHAENAVNKHMRKIQKDFFEHWSHGPTPWTYKGDGEELVEIKKFHLENIMKQSDRFIGMKTSTFDPKLAEIDSKFDNIKFTPFTLDVLQDELEGKHMVDTLIRNKRMTKDRGTYIRKVANSDEWKAIVGDWKELKKQANQVFRKKIKMRVFAYNDKMEKDTLLSPLDSIKYHRMILQTGVVAMEPGTGYVKAWVGGVNYKYFKQDHININRQVGSTFKPFVYSAAIAFQGISPCTKVLDIPYSISRGEGNFHLDKEWAPRNSDNEYLEEKITLYKGLRESKNTITVFLMKQLGDVTPVIRVAENMGIPKQLMPEVPSLCLGVADLSPLDMTAAYATFSNNGVYVKPTYISHITDENGRVIYRAIPEEHQALNPQTNYVMVDMLKNVAAGRPGISSLKTVNGGKTGTTQNQTDAWYMGITPNLVVGVWTGGEDRWVRYRTISRGQGSLLARPIFANFMHSVEADKALNFDTKAKFMVPAGENEIIIDCERYEELQRTLNKPEIPVVEDEEFFDG